MAQNTPREKRKHRRSVSKKLDDRQEYCFDKQSVIVEENKTAFDVQYFVQKSTQLSEEQTVIIDQLNDENSPPFITNNAPNLSYRSDTSLLNKKTPLSTKNKPNKQSDYYSLWEEDENFACLTKLKHYFHSDQNRDYNKAKLFREKHKNKILQINAEYQMFNCAVVNKINDGQNKEKVKSKRYSVAMERV